MIAYISSAFRSIYYNKVRSLLTVLGVVIGVSSVTTLVSLGQGLKNDVSSLIQGLGTNMIVVIGGSMDGQGNPANLVAGDILTLEDIVTLENMGDVQSVSPVSLVGGVVRTEEGGQVTPVILGSYPTILDSLEALELGQGTMFPNKTGDFAVLGPATKESLFGDTDPVGKTITIASRDSSRDLLVIGALTSTTSTSVFGSEFDNVLLVPFDTATEINGAVSISRIMIKAHDAADVAALKEHIIASVRDNHGGEEDFSVLTQDDLLELFNQFLNLSTALVSAIAAISLVVGGIGIMNIMLVTVTERTREIGLRKAVGATKLAILFQFLVEAIVITSLGGMIGLGASLGIGVIVASQTPLKPDITVEVFLMAIGVSMVTGIVFGLWPAFKAANKDPIEALRYE